ncbi:MAG: NAD(P)/FAD-dependent oxidoreductase [Bacteroidota bacterium]
MISLWEKESLLNYDIIIIGAGITGLSTAATLKETQPGLSILVIEKGTLPIGASTRNAGFACFGSVSELLEDIEKLGEEGMCRLVEKRWKGLEKTKNRLGASTIGFNPCGGYELIRPEDLYAYEKLELLNHLLKDILGLEVFNNLDSEIKNLGFENINHLIFNPYEGSLHTGKLMSAFWDYCQLLGVRIITGSEVQSIEKNGKSVRVLCGEYQFTSKAVGICTNAFTQKLASSVSLNPGRGIVMVVKTEKPITYQGTFHYDQGYYYFRNFEQKLLFGGARNLDLEAEKTLEFGINPKIKEKLEADLQEIIIPGQSYEIEMAWSGIMAFGESKAPVIQQLDDGIFVGARLGGMGVAIGSMVGEELANLIISRHF